MASQPPVRPGWRLSAAVYPFAAGAAAVNLFFLSLVLSWIGWPVLTPVQSVLGGLVLGLPATWTFARHIRRLVAEADTSPEPHARTLTLRKDDRARRMRQTQP